VPTFLLAAVQVHEATSQSVSQVPEPLPVEDRVSEPPNAAVLAKQLPVF
jgi:hypothetical protein